MTSPNKATDRHRSPSKIDFDIIICGGSYSGLSVAIALKQYYPAFKILIIDAADPDNFFNDKRSYALALDCKNMLERISVWDNISCHSHPIKAMQITDSEVNEPIRIKLLEINNSKTIGYMIRAADLKLSLYKRAQQLGINFQSQKKLIDLKNYPGYICATLNDSTSYNAKLLIAADGKFSQTRKLAKIKHHQFNYGQTGIVCTIQHELENHGIAVQHFFPSGPFAILPLNRRQISISWAENNSYAEYLLHCRREIFLEEIQKRIGRYLGKIELASEIQSYPLCYITTSSLIAERLITIGDAAHGVHPVFGQGLNLGLRDCAVAAELIISSQRLGLDIGSAERLEIYQKARRSDIFVMGMASHLTTKLFSNSNMILKIARDTMLRSASYSKLIRNFLTNQANGNIFTTKSCAKLLQNMDI